MTYDDADRPLSLVDLTTSPAPVIRSYIYSSPSSRPTTVNDAHGNNTTYTWRPDGLLGLMTKPGSGPFAFSYDASGNLKTLTDGMAQITTWNYDLEGRMTSKVYDDETVGEIFGYDALGRTTSRWTPAKGTTTYDYDADGNLLSSATPNDPAVYFVHDRLDRMVQMLDGTGTTTFQHANGKWNGETHTTPGGQQDAKVRFEFDGGGNRSLLELSDTVPIWQQTYLNDGLGRILEMTSSSITGTYGYSYEDKDGLFWSQWKKLALPGGGSVERNHDDLGQMTLTQMKNPSGTVLKSHAYLYSARGQRTKQTFVGGETIDYGYGYGGELATASTKDSSGNSVYGQQFAYTQDLAENITTRSTGAGYETFAHDWAGLNRATTAGQAGFYHDANGNPTYKFDYTPYPDSWDTFYTYDDRDRLVSVKSDAVYTPEWKRFWVEFEYDGLSRLKARRTYSWYSYYGGWYLSENVGYLYDGMTPVALRKYSGGTPYQTTYFTRGNDLSGTPGGAGGVGGLVAMSQQSSGGSQTAFYHNDGNGNVTGLMDQWGGLAGEYKYDPFGRDLGTSGWMSGQNPFRFSSKEWLAGPGLNHFGYRFYNTTTQKWLNRDPIREAGGINIYGFVGNDPINRIDPLGLWGIQFGDRNIGYGDPNLAFNNDSWTDLAQGAAATADGIIPFADPFQKYYDPCDPIFRASRTLGEIGRDVGLLAIPYSGMANLAKWARNPLFYEIGSTTVPAEVYAAMEGLSAIEKGKYLLFWYGPGGILALNAEAVGAGALSTTIPTGLTPGLSLFGVGALQAVDSASHKPCGYPK